MRPTAEPRARRSGSGFLSAIWYRPTNFGRVPGTLDLLAVLVSFTLCHRLYFGDLDFTSERLGLTIAAVVFSFVVLSVTGTYNEARRPRRLPREALRLLFAWSLTVSALGLFAFLAYIAEDVSRLWFGLSSTLVYATMVVVRTLWLAGRIAARSGDEVRAVAIIGARERGGRTIQRLRANLSTRYNVVAMFDDRVDVDDSAVVQGTVAELAGFVEKRRRDGQPVSEVWIMLPLAEEQRIRSVLDTLEDSSVDVCIVPDAFGLQLLSGSISRVADMPIVNVSDIRLAESAELFKAVFDRAVASVAIVLLFPIMAAVALAVKLDSPGPALFRQRRYGIDGQDIEVWKFRSMKVMEDGGKVSQATRGDVRVTRVGAFLRRSSLDELPQFFNVLQGSMSIVGPRPHAVSHNEEYRQRIQGYMLRHKIKPGITGWAQVNGWRGETDTLEKMEQRVRYDLEYIRNWTPGLDFKIMVMTVFRGFYGKNVY